MTTTHPNASYHFMLHPPHLNRQQNSAAGIACNEQSILLYKLSGAGYYLNFSTNYLY
ncbi:MAG: hypothetical protein AABX13_04250 [Nanoarchaeota archaeon]